MEVAAGSRIEELVAIAGIAVDPCLDFAILRPACFDLLADAEAAMRSYLAAAVAKSTFRVLA